MNAASTPLRVVAVHGAPRSGTSWLGEVFNSSEQVAYRYQPLFSYSFRDRISTTSIPEAIDAFFSDLYATRDDFVLQRGAGRVRKEDLRFQKGKETHLVYKEVRFHHLLPHLLESIPSLKAVGIVRDPRAVLSSWIQAPREFDRAWSPCNEWRRASLKNLGLEENWYGYERWKELAELFLALSHSYPRRFKLVQYEDTVLDPFKAIDSLFRFAELDPSCQVIDFVEASTSRDDDDPYGVHRSRVRQLAATHATSLPPGVSEFICSDLAGSPLVRFLAPRINP